jgi:predicted RNase H-like nuclease (RuvC/YqgF family)
MIHSVEVRRLLEAVKMIEGLMAVKISEWNALHAEVERLRAEIERLHGLQQEIKKQSEEIERLWGERAADKAEIERLKAALALSQSQNYCTLCGALEDKP